MSVIQPMTELSKREILFRWYESASLLTSAETRVIATIELLQSILPEIHGGNRNNKTFSTRFREMYIRQIGDDESKLTYEIESAGIVGTAAAAMY